MHDDATWTILRAAGVPLGHRGRDPRPALPAVREALSRVVTAELSPPERDALAAWLGALRRHYPSQLSAIGAEALVEPLVAGTDRDRYLKLRRIALANLARP